MHKKLVSRFLKRGGWLHEGNRLASGAIPNYVFGPVMRYLKLALEPNHASLTVREREQYIVNAINDLESIDVSLLKTLEEFRDAKQPDFQKLTTEFLAAADVPRPPTLDRAVYRRIQMHLNMYGYDKFYNISIRNAVKAIDRNHVLKADLDQLKLKYGKNSKELPLKKRLGGSFGRRSGNIWDNFYDGLNNE